MKKRVIIIISALAVTASILALIIIVASIIVFNENQKSYQEQVSTLEASLEYFNTMESSIFDAFNDVNTVRQLGFEFNDDVEIDAQFSRIMEIANNGLNSVQSNNPPSFSDAAEVESSLISSKEKGITVLTTIQTEYSIAQCMYGNYAILIDDIEGFENNIAISNDTFVIESEVAGFRDAIQNITNAQNTLDTIQACSSSETYSSVSTAAKQYSDYMGTWVTPVQSMIDSLEGGNIAGYNTAVGELNEKITQSDPIDSFTNATLLYMETADSVVSDTYEMYLTQRQVAFTELQRAAGEFNRVIFSSQEGAQITEQV